MFCIAEAENRERKSFQRFWRRLLLCVLLELIPFLRQTISLIGIVCEIALDLKITCLVAVPPPSSSLPPHHSPPPFPLFLIDHVFLIDLNCAS